MSTEKTAVPSEAAPLKLDFSIRTVTPTGNFLGVARVTVADAFVIDGLRILQGRDGIFAGMPSVPDSRKPGTYRDVVRPTSPEVYAQINKGLGAAYVAQVEKDQDRLIAIMANQKEGGQKGIKKQIEAGKKQAAKNNATRPDSEKGNKGHDMER